MGEEGSKRVFDVEDIDEKGQNWTGLSGCECNQMSEWVAVNASARSSPIGSGRGWKTMVEQPALRGGEGFVTLKAVDLVGKTYPLCDLCSLSGAGAREGDVWVDFMRKAYYVLIHHVLVTCLEETGCGHQPLFIGWCERLFFPML